MPRTGARLWISAAAAVGHTNGAAAGTARSSRGSVNVRLATAKNWRRVIGPAGNYGNRGIMSITCCANGLNGRCHTASGTTTGETGGSSPLRSPTASLTR